MQPFGKINTFSSFFFSPSEGEMHSKLLYCVSMTELSAHRTSNLIIGYPNGFKPSQRQAFVSL